MGLGRRLSEPFPVRDGPFTVAAPAPSAAAPVGGGGARARRQRARSLRARPVRRWRHVVALAPFAAYLGVFLVVPAMAVVVGAFESPKGMPTLSNLDIALNGTYR